MPLNRQLLNVCRQQVATVNYIANDSKLSLRLGARARVPQEDVIYAPSLN